MVQIIDAPFDGGGARMGSRLGPAALELAGLSSSLAALGLGVTRGPTIPIPIPIPEPGLRNFKGLFETVESLSFAVLQALKDKHTPIVLGGEHSISMGSLGAALEYLVGDLAVIWIDAHADINTPGGSASGNLHGMPLAALCGMPSGSIGLADEQWSQLVDSVARPHPLQLAHCAWIGLRDVDIAERKTIASEPKSLAITMHDIDRFGLVQQVERLAHWLEISKVKHVWISFDVDALDPILAPGTGTAVRGGLTYREAHMIAELLWELFDSRGCPYRLAGLDVVEINPLEDSNNATARVAVEWVASLFGKRILGVSE